MTSLIYRVGFHLLLLPLLGCAAISGLPAQPRPSVVLITIDTLRADYVPAIGEREISTPLLNRLARDGVVFKQAVTAAPLTLPAHVSLMTGAYPHFHGVRDNSGYRLAGGIPTLAAVLKRSGYRTAAFVASAVLDRSFGLDAGFDFYGDQFGETAFRVGVLAERRAKEVVDEALRWLKQHSGRPFFVWLHVYDPHAPYSAPEPYADRGYAGEIEYVDAQLARLVDYLTSAGQYESSLIAVLSDHGEDLDQHGEPTHGFFLYDTVLRIPWLLKLPGGEAAGRSIDDQVEIVDVAPTIAQALRLESFSQTQGTGRLSLILGKRGAEVASEAYAETLYPGRHFGWSPLFAVRDGRYKYIEAPRRELYDLLEDPGETRNLASQQTALAGRLAARLKSLRQRYQGETEGSALEIDPRLQARLSSLGYVTSSAAAKPEPNSGADPKDKLPVYVETYRGMEAFTEGDLQQALVHFRAALEKDSEVPLVHDYLGSTYLAMGKPGEAVDAYQQAIRLAPQRTESASNLAYAYLQAGRLEEAEAGFELATRLRPTDWQGWQLLGVTRIQLNRLDQAEKALREASSLSPANRQVLFNLGSVYQQQGKHLLAVQSFRALVEVAPEDAEAWNSLASNYDAAGLASEAEAAFQKAIAADPGYAPAYFNYGNLFARRRELAKAEAQYRKAIEADGSFALAYRNLAAVLELQGKQAEADRFRREFERLTSGS